MFRVIGNVRWIEYDATTGTETRRWHSENMITSGGLSLMRDYLIAGRPDLAPTPPRYIAMGSGLHSPLGRFLTTVPGETFRTPIVSADAAGTAAIFHCYLGMNDNNGGDGNGATVAAWGLFAGNANAAVDTGTLFAVIAEPTPFSKNGNATYSIDWMITVSGTMEA